MNVLATERTLPFRVSAWGRRRQWTLVGLGALAAISGGWLAYEFWRLLFQSGLMGAVDLLLRYDEVNRWFAGLDVYSNARTATYPPASLVLLWPFVGWLPQLLARWLWAALSLACLGWLIVLLLRNSGASRWPARLFIALLPLSSYAAGAAIGNGQLIVIVLPAVLTAVVLLHSERRWPWHLLAAGLLLAALVKPTLAAPFFWIALFGGSVVWPALIAAVGYAALNLFAAQFQPTALPTLLREWLANSQQTAVGSSGANLHAWLAALGLANWISVASLLVLIMLGAWTYRHRKSDLWLLIGVTSIVTNFWSYHLWYDDLILVLPAITLFRLGRSSSDSLGLNVPYALLGAWVIADLAPGGLYALPASLSGIYVAAQTALRLGVLAYFIDRARRQPAVAASVGIV